MAVRRLKGVSLQTLQLGHSHEDIDQMFSSLATHIRNESELHCPSDFVQSIQSWLDQPQTRPSEKFKRCFKLDQVRAWILGQWVIIQPVVPEIISISIEPGKVLIFYLITRFFL